MLRPVGLFLSLSLSLSLCLSVLLSVFYSQRKRLISCCTCVIYIAWFVANLFSIIQPVKEFWKWLNIWQRYYQRTQMFDVLFPKSR